MLLSGADNQKYFNIRITRMLPPDVTPKIFDLMELIFTLKLVNFIFVE